MPTEDINSKALAEIRRRSVVFTDSREQVAPEIELLAAIADGTLPFDQVDEETLAGCVKTFGSDAVIDALISAEDLSVSEEGILKHASGSDWSKAEDAKNLPLQIPKKPTVIGTRSSNRLRWIAAIAAVAIVSTFVFRETRPPTNPTERIIAENDLHLQWPAKPPFEPSSLHEWGLPNIPLPKGLPDFATGAATLGTRRKDPFEPWRLATVVVQSKDGWGSGAFISADGWLLTNYHLVAGATQRAAVIGGPASLDVITAGMIDGQLKSQPAFKATLYRADPSLDLALLKLDSLPADRKLLPFFEVGSKVQVGEDCFVIGSQSKGIEGKESAWSVGSGNISRAFNYPEGSGDLAAHTSKAGAVPDRHRFVVTVTDVPFSAGASGGPLVNERGELIGLNFATPANAHPHSVGWHISLSQLREFVASLPAQPEGVPFDPWTAGLPDAEMLEPEFADADGDGRIDSLRYRYASHTQNGLRQPLALSVFVDLTERAESGKEEMDMVPHGLWGMENRGRFRFNVFVTVRADHWTAVGYTNEEGVVDEIRLGSESQRASVIWRRHADSTWVALKPGVLIPLIDPAKFTRDDFTRLQMILGRIFDSSGERSLGKTPSSKSD